MKILFFLCLVVFVALSARILLSVFHYRKLSFESHLCFWFLFCLNFGVLAFALELEDSLNLKIYTIEALIITFLAMFTHKKMKASRSSIYRWITIFRN